MATPLNEYATKIFSEQPSGLWALDDKIDYLSLIPTVNQDLSTWTSTGVDSVVDATDGEVFSDPPPSLAIPQAYANGVIASADNNGIVQFVFPTPYSSAAFASEIKTFALGLYIYSYSKIVDVRLGYRYINPSDGQTYEVIKAAATSTTLAWASVSESFTIPDNFQDLEFLIEVYYQSEGAVYEFAINGITAGQWAEEFQLTSLGLDSIITNLDQLYIAIDTDQSAIEAKPYGLNGLSGYYMVRDNKILAQNNAAPLVFGSRNSTKILPNIEGEPSVIIPGLGFLNQSSANVNMTAEFWLNVFSQSTQQRKIVGPIGSSDGLYVDGPFLKLKIGNVSGSHYVREWARPMLVDIRVSTTRADLLINGEETISLNLEGQDYTYPAATNESNNTQDWLGFYAYNDVPYLMVDCVAIYPYLVPRLVAKRRYGYGQAVKFPVDIKGLDSSKTITIDHSFSNYYKNYTFPETGDWNNAVLENLSIEDDALEAPTYALPQFVFNDKTEAEWLSALGDANDSLTDTFISLRPDYYTNTVNPINWQTTEGYILFNELDFLPEVTKAFYGIFETTEAHTEKQTLIKLVNDINGNYIEIYLAPYNYSDEYTQEPETEINIYYALNFTNFDGTRTEEIFYQSRGQRVGDRFLVGLDIDRFVQDKGQQLSAFFGNRKKLKMYVGGENLFRNTYQGKIRRIAFCNANNFNKVKHFFGERGIPVDYENVFNFFGEESYDAGDSYFGDGDAAFNLILDGGTPYDFITIGTEEHTASYTLMGKNTLSGFNLEIDTNSYWEGYLPLSYFAKEVTDAFGDISRAVSFVQLNLDYPNLNVVDGNYINTNGEQVRCYVSFQYLSNGANSLLSSFTSRQAVPHNMVISPGTEWTNTLYEVVDGSIIYPPDNVNIDQLAMHIHLEIENENSLGSKVRLRSLELTSQSYKHQPTPIGTRFGNKITPFSKSGNYFNYKDVAPIQIDKKIAPYLYQSSQTGIRMLTEYKNNHPYGLSMSVNSNASAFFKLSSMQMAIKYDEPLMPDVPVKIFEIETANDTIEFFLISDSVNQDRGQIYAIQAGTNRLQPGVVFFNNGLVAKRPVVYPQTWTMLGISFPEFLDMSNVFGALRFTSPLRFNNITFYQTTVSDDEERFGFRQWFSVRNTLGTDLEWGYWAGKEVIGGEVVPIPGAGFTWREVLFLSAILREEVDASNIYNIYTGTAKIISETGNNLKIQDYEYNVFSNLIWQQNTVSAV